MEPATLNRVPPRSGPVQVGVVASLLLLGLGMGTAMAPAMTSSASLTTAPSMQPPETEPTLAVVSSSMRPSGIAAIASAAATIALRPSSGRMPAWAAWPWNSAPTR